MGRLPRIMKFLARADDAEQQPGLILRVNGVNDGPRELELHSGTDAIAATAPTWVDQPGVGLVLLHLGGQELGILRRPPDELGPTRGGGNWQEWRRVRSRWALFRQHGNRRAEWILVGHHSPPQRLRSFPEHPLEREVFYIDHKTTIIVTRFSDWGAAELYPNVASPRCSPSSVGRIMSNVRRIFLRLLVAEMLLDTK